MKVLTLTHDEGGGKGASCTYDAENPEMLVEEIKEMKWNEAGERWIIDIGEMPENEFKNLPEFNGW